MTETKSSAGTPSFMRISYPGVSKSNDFNDAIQSLPAQLVLAKAKKREPDGSVVDEDDFSMVAYRDLHNDVNIEWKHVLPMRRLLLLIHEHFEALCEAIQEHHDELDVPAILGQTRAPFASLRSVVRVDPDPCINYILHFNRVATTEMDSWKPQESRLAVAQLAWSEGDGYLRLKMRLGQLVSMLYTYFLLNARRRYAKNLTAILTWRYHSKSQEEQTTDISITGACCDILTKLHYMYCFCDPEVQMHFNNMLNFFRLVRLPTLVRTLNHGRFDMTTGLTFDDCFKGVEHNPADKNPRKFIHPLQMAELALLPDETVGFFMRLIEAARQLDHEHAEAVAQAQSLDATHSEDKPNTLHRQDSADDRVDAVQPAEAVPGPAPSPDEVH